ncbi:MAG: FAD-dependent oxidoreductase [Arenicellales bacterium]
MTSTATRYLILGGGPCGIAAALRLLELGVSDFMLVERNDYLGGLATSHVDDEGFTWDLGGHVQFSHYEKFDEYMALALGEDDWLHHERQSWIYQYGRYIPYPLQLNLHHLPDEKKWACVSGLLDASRSANSHEPRDFEEWIHATFGAGLAEEFMLPYNFKVWAHPPKTMSYQWIGERVAVPALDKVLKSICLNEDNISWGPNNTFRFPRKGGTGAIWKSLGGRLPPDRVVMNGEIHSLDLEGKRVSVRDYGSVAYDCLINTIPVDRLCGYANEPRLREPAARFAHSSTHVIGIGLRGQPPVHLEGKCWIYFPESQSPYYRVTVFSNYSPNNTPLPGEAWSLMVEVSESAHKKVTESEIVDQTVAALRRDGLIDASERILSRWHIRLEYGYPTPFKDRDEALEEVHRYLESRSVYSRGRFGGWKYEVSNQDHSFMQGMEIVERLVHDCTEPTYRDPALVNGRRNPFPYPEWSR